MEVSKPARELGGQELLTEVIQLTGLPPALVQDELAGILEASGKSSQDLTLEELRVALAGYLETLQQDLEADSNGSSAP